VTRSGSPTPAGAEACDLATALAAIGGHFDVDAIVSRVIDRAHIVEYYRQCDPAYAAVHCPEGALHLALARDGAIEDGAYYQQADRVQPHLVRLGARRVLEIGCGNGFNLFRLARLNPRVRFTGIDLAPDHVASATREGRWLENLDFRPGDFADMPWLERGELDAVLAVESMCQGTNMPATLKEAHRVLRPGGLLAVFDCFRGSVGDAVGCEMQTAIRLVEKSTAVGAFWPLSRWLQLARELGFREVGLTDLRAAVWPDLLRLQAIARAFFGSGPLNRELSRLCSPLVLENAISGLLMPITVAAGALGYHFVVLERDGSERCAGPNGRSSAGDP
jgi:SAM-dependent methyltransferase